MIDLNPEFKQALEQIQQGGNLFITGKAGTGKTTLLRYHCAHTTPRPVVLAPTGVAALNIGGQTVHSFFSFSIDVTPQKIQNRKIRPRYPKIYPKLKTLIIDEASMLRADLLDCMDVFLRIYGPNTSPFGGVQMIFVGDLYQLPPVVKGQEREIFSSHYDSPYFYSAHAFPQLNIQLIQLHQVYRQHDAHFIGILNRIRNGTSTPQDINDLNQRCQPPTHSISLTATNRQADNINNEHLSQLPTQLHTSEAEIKGDFGKEYYPTATTLNFKDSAQIMMLNNDQEQRWVNGTIGTIITTDPLQIQLQNGNTVEVNPHTWEVFKVFLKNKTITTEAVGSFIQYPFRLAWAITIHKSQGLTFDNINVSSGIFTPGQLYVALSRCTTLTGITLQKPLSPGHIRVDHRVKQFLIKLRTQDIDTPQIITQLTQAINTNQQLHMLYIDGNDTETTRTIIPRTLSTETFRNIEFQALKAHCTLRQADRTFRIDRILSLQPTDA